MPEGVGCEREEGDGECGEQYRSRAQLCFARALDGDAERHRHGSEEERGDEREPDREH